MALAEHYIDVLVPLATVGKGVDGSICELRASFSDDVGAAKSGYDPAIVPLLDAKLGAAGKRALDAVRRLPLVNKKHLARFRLTKPRSRRSLLTPLDVRQARGLDPQNASSAELGLALALCCLERGKAHRTFFATGAFDGSGASDVSSNDGPIGPVGGLPQKIAAVATWLERHRVGTWGKNATFFVPLKTINGEDTLEAHREDIGKAQKSAAAVGTELQFIPLTSLAEGADILGANQPPADQREILARTVAVSGLALAALAAVAFQPLTLQPAPIDFFLGPLTTPQVMTASDVQDSGKRVFHPVVACLSKTDLPLVQYDNYLSVRFETNKTILPASFISILFVIVGQLSPPKFYTHEQIVLPTDPVEKIDGRVVFGGSFAIGPPQEEMKIVALARHLGGFDTDEMAKNLNRIRKDEAPEAVLNSQARWLASLPSAYEEVSFRAVDPSSESAAKCGS